MNFTDPDIPQLLDDEESLHKIWNLPAQKIGSKQTSEAFARFSAHIRQEQYRKGIQKWLTAGTSVAAIIAVALSLWFYFYPQNVIQWTELSIPYGRTDSVYLADGTLVRTNAGTRLMYPTRFMGKQRQVFLSGEAFFDVAHDVHHPFIVTTEGINIKVTGTSFNVKSYPEENVITTTLITGSVIVNLPESAFTYNMEPEHTLTFNRKNGNVTYLDNKQYEKPAWFRNELNFFNCSLTEIAHELERRFNVDIVIRNPEAAETKFYASFVNNETVDEVLKRLNTHNLMKIKRTGDVIDIF